jgi:hypothetical protein
MSCELNGSRNAYGRRRFEISSAARIHLPKLLPLG